MILRPPRSTLFPYTTLFRSGIEVKASKRVAPSDVRGLLAFEEETRLRKKIIVSNEPRERRTDEGVTVLPVQTFLDRKSTRLNSSHVEISYAVFCLKKKKKKK